MQVLKYVRSNCTKAEDVRFSKRNVIIALPGNFQRVFQSITSSGSSRENATRSERSGKGLANATDALTRRRRRQWRRRRRRRRRLTVVVYAVTNICLSTQRGSRYHPALSRCAPQTTCIAKGGTFDGRCRRTATKRIIKGPD